MPHPLPTLSLTECRVLGVLVEKQLTTPDYYPLTLNALAAGCNQKTSRDPVMHATESELQAALDTLRGLSLLVESYGASGRVMRYAHNLDRVLHLAPPVVAILAVLILRGPQTAGELRGNCERLYRFADISTVEAYLEEMAARSAGALVMQLARQPGSREHRYAHLLAGEPPPGEAAAGDADDIVTAGELSALRANVRELRAEVGELRALVERLYAELGVTREAGPQ